MAQDKGGDGLPIFTIRPKGDGGVAINFGASPTGGAYDSGARRLEPGKPYPTPEITGRVDIESEQLIRHFGS